MTGKRKAGASAGAVAKSLATPTRAEERATAALSEEELDKEIVFSFRVTKRFKRQFQLWCVSHGKTQSAALEDALRLLVREYGD